MNLDCIKVKLQHIKTSFNICLIYLLLNHANQFLFSTYNSWETYIKVDQQVVDQIVMSIHLKAQVVSHTSQHVKNQTWCPL
jgi:hypothetical protein